MFWALQIVISILLIRKVYRFANLCMVGMNIDLALCVVSCVVFVLWVAFGLMEIGVFLFLCGVIE